MAEVQTDSAEVAATFAALEIAKLSGFYSGGDSVTRAREIATNFAAAYEVIRDAQRQGAAAPRRAPRSAATLSPDPARRA